MKNKYDIKINLDYSKLKELIKLLLFVRDTPNKRFNRRSLPKNLFRVESNYGPAGTSEVIVSLYPSDSFINFTSTFLANNLGLKFINSHE